MNEQGTAQTTTAKTEIAVEGTGIAFDVIDSLSSGGTSSGDSAEIVGEAVTAIADIADCAAEGAEAVGGVASVVGGIVSAIADLF